MISPVEIELATYVSWPAFEQVDYQGWILRFASGYTKRANSVNALVPSGANVAEAVAHCESFYKARHQPTIFRLLSFVNDPELDPALADAGYSFIDPSIVLCKTLDQADRGAPPLISLDRKLWFTHYMEISGADPSKQAAHSQILEKIPGNSLFAEIEQQGEPVACGLGVIHESCFGIFDIVTRKENRQMGLGTQLVKGMLDWAGGNGAQYAYVQVMAQNAPAVRLYEKLGYRRLYHYWYRIQKSL